MGYQFDWGLIVRDPNWQRFLIGFGRTLLLGLTSWGIALFLGIIIGAIRSLPYKIPRMIGRAYVEFFRNIPLLVQLFFWYYVIPPMIGQWFNRLPSLPWIMAIFGLGIYTASRVGEHVRSGFSSIPKGQHQAGLSTGLTEWQLYRHVLIPYGFRLMIPPITTEFLTIFKNSALAMTIGVMELSGQAYRIGTWTFHSFETISTAVVGYLIIGLTVIAFMGWVEKKLRIPGLVGRG
jgi:glutamate/aspartate transport system permease protein